MNDSPQDTFETRPPNFSYHPYKGFIFDLDGTLLHTLPDLVIVANSALTAEGFSPHSQEAILSFVGDGARSLIRQAIPPTATPEQAEKVYQNFKTFYHEFGIHETKEYEGMIDTLMKAKQAGVKLGIVSNKFDGGVHDVVESFFKGIIDAAYGESDDIPRKPDPTGILRCVADMGLTPVECLYFGDSASDMQAAHNAGLKGVGVTWGYQPLKRLMGARPDYLIDAPNEILNFAGVKGDSLQKPSSQA